MKAKDATVAHIPRPFVNTPKLYIETICVDGMIKKFRAGTDKKKVREFPVNLKTYNIQDAWNKVEKYIGTVKL